MNQKVWGSNCSGAYRDGYKLYIYPYGVHFLGFTAATVVFDITMKLIGYNKCFKKLLFTNVSVLLVSIRSAAVAGMIIGAFFMAAPALAR